MGQAENAGKRGCSKTIMSTITQPGMKSCNHSCVQQHSCGCWMNTGVCTQDATINLPHNLVQTSIFLCYKQIIQINSLDLLISENFFFQQFIKTILNILHLAKHPYKHVNMWSRDSLCSQIGSIVQHTVREYQNQFTSIIYDILLYKNTAYKSFQVFRSHQESRK